MTRRFLAGLFGSALAAMGKGWRDTQVVKQTRPIIPVDVTLNEGDYTVVYPAVEDGWILIECDKYSTHVLGNTLDEALHRLYAAVAWRFLEAANRYPLAIYHPNDLRLATISYEKKASGNRSIIVPTQKQYEAYKALLEHGLEWIIDVGIPSREQYDAYKRVYAMRDAEG